MAVKEPTKVCVIVLRAAELLVFRHPKAGIQFVKGTIEEGEMRAAAALRELEEESGIRAAAVERDLGVWESQFKEQAWSFHLCSVDKPLPDEWVHRTPDGGGLDFHFFWHPLASEPGDDWRPVFRRAFVFVRESLRSEGTLNSDSVSGLTT
jgi:8-oxo-dGTP pyrophosphatase MutT (NUDIX family)